MLGGKDLGSFFGSEADLSRHNDPALCRCLSFIIRSFFRHTAWCALVLIEMEVVYARRLADAVGRALNVRLPEAVELHVRVSGAQPGFQVTCVSALPLNSWGCGRDMDTSNATYSMVGLLAFLGDSAASVKHTPDMVSSGFRLEVEGWAPEEYRRLGACGRAVVASRVVEEVRARVESLALVHAGVNWTVYDMAARRFVFKSLQRDTSLSKAIEFFGGVDADLVVSLDDGVGGVVDGWRVSGHAVLPPVGHPSTSRQRVYINGVLVQSEGCSGYGDIDCVEDVASVYARIESLYQDAYSGAVRQLPSRAFGGQLAVVRKGLNAHPMYILEISMANKDARRDARARVARRDDRANENALPRPPQAALTTHAALLRMPDVVAAVERAFLLAWSKSLTGRLIKLLEATSRQEHAEVESMLEHQIVRVDTRRSSRREQGKNRPQSCLPDTEGSDAQAVHQESLFDDLEAPHNSSHVGIGDDMHPEMIPFLPKRRRSVAGLDAINTILDGKSPSEEICARSIRLMPHTASHSAFANPVVTASALQPSPPPVARDDLANATRVLGQIELKFIAFVTPPDTSASSKLAIIDQHAADERVRLEHLTQLAVLPSNRPNGAHVHSQALPTPTYLYVGADEEALFHTYRRDAYAWGWQWEHSVGRIDQARARGGLRHHHKTPASLATVVTHVPMLFGRMLSVADLKLYLYQLARVGYVGGNLGGVVPDAVRRALASLACRSAIMFGDHVDLATASKLVYKLSRTKQYTECAHGRPTVACLWRGSQGRATSKSNMSTTGPNKILMSLADLKAKLVFETK